MGLALYTHCAESLGSEHAYPLFLLELPFDHNHYPFLLGPVLSLLLYLFLLFKIGMSMSLLELLYI